MKRLDMVGIMRGILALPAEKLEAGRGELKGKKVAGAIGEALARAAMQGDIKATAMLMELAGTDFRSRDSDEKHLIDRAKLNLGGAPEGVVIEDIRPGEGPEAD